MMGLESPVRQTLRDRLLDAAWDLVEAGGWDRLRVSHVAAKAGASRQSAYNEFGCKDSLGEALVLREYERHLEGLQETLLDRRDDVFAAVYDSVLFTFRQAERSRLLAGVLTSSRIGWGDAEFMALLRGRSLLPTAIEVLGGMVVEARPDLEPEYTMLAVEMVFRSTISYLVNPGDLPHDERARRVAVMACRVLGVPVR